MINKVSITVIKDRQVIKYIDNIPLDLSIDYFKMYNSYDYDVTINDENTGAPVMYKSQGVSL